MGVIRHRTGNTAENNARVGKPGLITQDTEAHALRVYDGATPGGVVIPGNKVELPTGPGPGELLAGDYDLGFYGEVSSGDFITFSDLTSEVGVTEGESLPQSELWLKFAYQGKTLFQPYRTIRGSISWEALYQSGLVYGVDGVGRDPLPNNEPVNQYTTISVQGRVFIVRCMRLGNGNPATELGREMDLLLNINAKDVNNANWGIDYSESWMDFNNTQNFWGQETPSESPKDRLQVGYNVIDRYGFGRATANFSYRGWRPVLEMVV